MCGLSGEIRLDGGRPDIAAVERMTDRLAPRGPDGRGLWSQGPVALGHRLLKIIDLSECGAQPMTDPGARLTGVFNGCVYNYRELRDELHALGHRFFSHSDTEVVLKAYQQWGADCVDRFLGMFAFVIVEQDTGRVVLARDRLGIKPLYLSATSERLRFASSLPALLAVHGVDTSPRPRRPAPVPQLARHRRRAPHRPQRRAQAAPATVRVVEPDGTQHDRRYWNPCTPDAPPTRTSPPTTGPTRSWTPCVPRCAAAWSPTCRWACCSPAAWTPA